MNRLAEYFIRSAIIYLLAGMAIGIVMASSHDYRLTGAHAHLNLLGWASMALFAGYYQLNPLKAETRLAWAHFWVWSIAIWIMIPSLAALLLGNPGAEPVVALSSLIMISAAAIFAVVVFRPVRRAVTPAGALPA